VHISSERLTDADSYTLSAHPRNVPDDVLDALKANGGVIMICFLPSLSSLDSKRMPASIATVVEHVIYAGTTIGYKHVGIGSDFDGMLEGPPGLDDVSAYPALVAELLARNVAEDDVRAVLGLNVLRVLADVDQHAVQEQRSGTKRLCDLVEGVWTEAQRKIMAGKGSERRAIGVHHRWSVL